MTDAAEMVCLRPNPRPEAEPLEEWLCGRPACTAKYNDEAPAEEGLDEGPGSSGRLTEEEIRGVSPRVQEEEEVAKAKTTKTKPARAKKAAAKKETIAERRARWCAEAKAARELRKKDTVEGRAALAKYLERASVKAAAKAKPAPAPAE